MLRFGRSREQQRRRHDAGSAGDGAPRSHRKPPKVISASDPQSACTAKAINESCLDTASIISSTSSIFIVNASLTRSFQTLHQRDTKTKYIFIYFPAAKASLPMLATLAPTRANCSISMTLNEISKSERMSRSLSASPPSNCDARAFRQIAGAFRIFCSA
jgi:hypothetical protein